MQLTISQNSLQQTVRVLLRDSKTGGTMHGLYPHSKELVAAYLRDSDARPTPIPLKPWQEGHFTAGAFREVDAQKMPGLYEISLPDALFDTEAHRATVMIHSPEIISCIIDIDLVAYDPYDRYRLGLDCLSREARHGVISRAFREVVPEIVREFQRQE